MVDCSITGNSAINSPSERDAHCVQTFRRRTLKMSKMYQQQVTTWTDPALVMCGNTLSKFTHCTPLLCPIVDIRAIGSIFFGLQFIAIHPLLQSIFWQLARIFGRLASRCLAMCGNGLATPRLPSLFLTTGFPRPLRYIRVVYRNLVPRKRLKTGFIHTVPSSCPRADQVYGSHAGNRRFRRLQRCVPIQDTIFTLY